MNLTQITNIGADLKLGPMASAGRNGKTDLKFGPFLKNLIGTSFTNGAKKNDLSKSRGINVLIQTHPDIQKNA